MAGNRLQKAGSIFERLNGILKSGAMKEQDKPIWYDVYKAFPPKYEPAFARPPVVTEIKSIFYPEDIIRGKFLKIYGNVSVHNMLTTGSKSIIQRFVEKYHEIEKSGQYSDEEAIFRATELAFEKEGITFMRSNKATSN